MAPEVPRISTPSSYGRVSRVVYQLDEHDVLVMGVQKSIRMLQNVKRNVDRDEHQLHKCRAQGQHQVRVCIQDASRPFGFTWWPCNASGQDVTKR